MMAYCSLPFPVLLLLFGSVFISVSAWFCLFLPCWPSQELPHSVSLSWPLIGGLSRPVSLAPFDLSWSSPEPLLVPTVLPLCVSLHRRHFLYDIPWSDALYRGLTWSPPSFVGFFHFRQVLAFLMCIVIGCCFPIGSYCSGRVLSE